MEEQLNARQRRDLIARHIRDQTQVKVSELVEEFGLTDTSIRRDLSILEKEGLLRRIHGGAISTSEGLHIIDFKERSSHFSHEKRVIGSFASKFIKSKDVIILDSGTTVFQVAKHIPNSLRQLGTLRIVTNSTMLLDEIGLWATPNLLLLGGIYLPEYQATVGPEVLEKLHKISAQRVFLGCDGLTLDGGITTAHPLIAEAGKAMASRAEQVIVLADYSKLGRAGFVPIMDIENIDVLITDSAAPEQILSGLRERGVQVLLASDEDR